MAKVKSMGEMGSPCRRPQAWPTASPGMPLMDTLVEAVESSMETPSRHRLPNPRCFRISKMNAQETESKARAMSSFRRNRGSFRL